MTTKEKSTKFVEPLAFLEDIEGLNPKERGISFEISLENIEEVGDDG